MSSSPLSPLVVLVLLSPATHALASVGEFTVQWDTATGAPLRNHTLTIVSEVPISLTWASGADVSASSEIQVLVDVPEGSDASAQFAQHATDLRVDITGSLPSSSSTLHPFIWPLGAVAPMCAWRQHASACLLLASALAYQHALAQTPEGVAVTVTLPTNFRFESTSIRAPEGSTLEAPLTSSASTECSVGHTSCPSCCLGHGTCSAAGCACTGLYKGSDCSELSQTREIRVNVNDTFVPVATGSLAADSGSGTFSVTDAESPAFGLEVLVDEGASDAQVDLSVGVTADTEVSGLPEDSEASAVVQLSAVSQDSSALFAATGGVFDVPVTLSLPALSPEQKSGSLFLAYHVEEGALDAMGLKDDSGRIAAAALGAFVSVGVPSSVLDAFFTASAASASLTTGFDPALDGIPGDVDIGNNYIAAVLLSKWYFTHFRERQSAEPLGRAFEPETLARAVQLAQLRASGIPANATASPANVAKALAHGLYVTGLPQLLWLSPEFDGAISPTAMGRPVLVTGCDHAAGSNTTKFFAFDPAYPGTVRTVEFELASQQFAAYDTFTGFATFGPRSFRLTFADYQALLAEDAAADDPVVSASAQQDPSSAQAARLTGFVTVAEGRPMPLFVYVFVENEQTVARQRLQATFSRSSGSFSITLVDLVEGNNQFRVVATGYEESTKALDTRASSFFGGFGVRGVSYSNQHASPLLQITLTWDKGGHTDLDLHVVRPDGVHVYYANRRESEGAFLDFDNTQGYGPENFLVQQTAVVPKTGTYRFRVHYYAGSVPTTWTLSVSRRGRRLATYTGTLTTYDSSQAGSFDSSCSCYGPTFTVDLRGGKVVVLSDRPVQNTLVLFHYSLKLFDNVMDSVLMEEVNLADFIANNPEAQQVASVELLREGEYTAWRRSGGCWEQQDDLAVSRIHYSDSGTKAMALRSADLESDERVQGLWDAMMQQAGAYAWAEQPPEGSAPEKWPRSQYRIWIGSTNSNTFVRFLLQSAGIHFRELGGSHPGANTPADPPDANEYMAGKIWRSDGAPVAAPGEVCS